MALQVALLRIWRDLPSLRDPDRVEAWAYRALVRACHDELRKRRRQASRSASGAAAQAGWLSRARW